MLALAKHNHQTVTPVSTLNSKPSISMIDTISNENSIAVSNDNKGLCSVFSCKDSTSTYALNDGTIDIATLYEHYYFYNLASEVHLSTNNKIRSKMKQVITFMNFDICRRIDE